MKAIIWTKEGCPLCEREEALLRAEGYEAEVRDMERVDRNDDDDLTAFAWSQMHDGAVPVVMIDGKIAEK